MRAFLRLFCRDVRSCEQIVAKEMVAGVGGTLRSLLKKKKKDRYVLLPPFPVAAWNADVVAATGTME